MKPSAVVGRPTSVTILRESRLIFFDPSKSPDCDIAADIGTFKRTVVDLLREEKQFCVDLSRTYLCDDGLKSLVGFLMSCPSGMSTSPVSRLKRLNLSETRITREGLKFLFPVLCSENVDYINICTTYASDIESISEFIEHITTAGMPEVDACRLVHTKLIWVRSDYFMRSLPPISDEEISTHKEFYGLQ